MHDEDELKLLLGGKPEEQEAGIQALIEQFSRPLWSFVLEKFPGLRHEDVGEIVNDAFEAVWRRIEAGTFDLNKPLASFLFKVAQNKAIDRIRKYKARIERTVDDDIMEVAERIRETEAGQRWKMVSTHERAREIQQAFTTFLRTLPPVQRAVTQVMADNFPDELGQEATANEVLVRTGMLPTMASIKGARTEIRKKFKEYLAKNNI